MPIQAKNRYRSVWADVLDAAVVSLCVLGLVLGSWVLLRDAAEFVRATRDRAVHEEMTSVRFHSDKGSEVADKGF